MMGQIFPKDELFLRKGIGIVEGRQEYEVATIVGTQEPIIHSKKTGKYFVLDWTEIVKLAIEAGIDK